MISIKKKFLLSSEVEENKFGNFDIVCAVPELNYIMANMFRICYLRAHEIFLIISACRNLNCYVLIWQI